MFNDEILNELKEIQEKYEAEVSRVLSKIPKDEKEHTTFSGLKVKPLYAPGDIAGIDFLKDIEIYDYTGDNGLVQLYWV